MATDLYESLVQEIPMGLLVVQANGAISVINAAALELLSIPRRIAVRSRLQEVLPQAPPELLGDGATTARMKLDDRDILLTACPFEGGESARLITMRDVTNQSFVDRIKSAFVSDLLHKIRTPLTTIKSGLSALACARVDPTRIDTAALIDMSRGETDRLVNVLDDIRDLFLVDTGLLADELDLEDIDAVELLAGLRESMLSRAENAGLELREVVSGGPARVRADSRLLERALRKVVQNAIHYTPAGGQVSLSVRPCGDRIEIALADDGPGMPEDVEMRAFDRFFRGAAAPAHVPDGIGLGLTLARDLIRLMGGDVQMETGAGMGTCVSVLLPRALPVDP